MKLQARDLLLCLVGEQPQDYYQNSILSEYETTLPQCRGLSRFTGHEHVLRASERSPCGLYSGGRCLQRLAELTVESWLSKRAHFSREGHMKVAETFDRETMMLPMGTASYLM